MFSVLKGQKKWWGGSINYLLLLLLGRNLKRNQRTTHICATGHHSQSTVHSALDVRTIYQNSTKSQAWCCLPLTIKTYLSQHFDRRTSRNAWVMLRDGTCHCSASQNLFKHNILEHTIPNSVKFSFSTGYLSSHCQLFNLIASWDNFRS